jgi:hypothetical protein
MSYASSPRWRSSLDWRWRSMFIWRLPNWMTDSSFASGFTFAGSYVAANSYLGAVVVGSGCSRLDRRPPSGRRHVRFHWTGREIKTKQTARGARHHRAREISSHPHSWLRIAAIACFDLRGAK